MTAPQCSQVLVGTALTQLAGRSPDSVTRLLIAILQESVGKSRAKSMAINSQKLANHLANKS